MVDINLYSMQYKAHWDRFINASNNGTFLFLRDYLEYHADRFQDHSLMFWDGTRLMGVLPANRKGNILYSHGGLTYGGLVTANGCKTMEVLEIFSTMIGYLKSIGISELVYKVVPFIYHLHPDEKDVYALFLHNAQLVKRGLSSSICLSDHRIPGHRRNGAVRSRKLGVEVRRSTEFAAFMQLVEQGLMQKYGIHAVHSPQEMTLLAARFPENIKLFAAVRDDEMIGGALIYETVRVAHAQYMAANEAGQTSRAQDLLTVYLIDEYYREKQWFDFGISTDHSGREINQSLLRHKEEYGSTAICYDVYSLSLGQI